MSPRKDNIRALLAKAESQLGKIEAEYNKSLHTQAIDSALRIDIKNVCENIRSALDYLAHDIRERHCPSAPSSGRFYFPILPDKKTFDDKIDQWFPGLRTASPAVVAALEAIQPFQSGHEWLGQFNRLTNENKHEDLVPQTRVEYHETRVTDQAGNRVSWASSAVRLEGVSVLGVPIDSKTQLPVPNASVKGERIIWVDFQFADIGVSALGLLKKTLQGVRNIEATIRPLL